MTSYSSVSRLFPSPINHFTCLSMHQCTSGVLELSEGVRGEAHLFCCLLPSLLLLLLLLLSQKLQMQLLLLLFVVLLQLDTHGDTRKERRV